MSDVSVTTENGNDINIDADNATDVSVDSESGGDISIDANNPSYIAVNGENANHFEVSASQVVSAPASTPAEASAVAVTAINGLSGSTVQEILVELEARTPDIAGDQSDEGKLVAVSGSGFSLVEQPVLTTNFKDLNDVPEGEGIIVRTGDTISYDSSTYLTDVGFTDLNDVPAGSGLVVRNGDTISYDDSNYLTSVAFSQISDVPAGEGFLQKIGNDLIWDATPYVPVGASLKIFDELENISESDEGKVLGVLSNGTLSLINQTGGSGQGTTLSVATDSALGGIQTGYTTEDQNYAVKVDQNNKAFVNVPWTTGIQTGYTTQDKNYAIQVDEDNKGFVNVPWTSGPTYGAATDSTLGLLQTGYTDNDKLIGLQLDDSNKAYVDLSNFTTDSGVSTFAALTEVTTSNVSFSAIAQQAGTTLNVSYLGNNYIFDQYGNTNNPEIFAKAGQTIAFNLSALNGAHPFAIKDGAGNFYSEGLTHYAADGTKTVGSDAQAKTSGTLYWKIPAGITGNYNYICTAHASMTNSITIESASAALNITQSVQSDKTVLTINPGNTTVNIPHGVTPADGVSHGVKVIYADNANGDNPSFTQGAKEFAGFYPWSGTEPSEVPNSGVNYTRFVGINGVDGVGTNGVSHGVKAIYASDANGTQAAFSQGDKKFINFYPWSETEPTEVPSGLTYTQFIGTADAAIPGYDNLQEGLVLQTDGDGGLQWGIDQTTSGGGGGSGSGVYSVLGLLDTPNAVPTENSFLMYDLTIDDPEFVYTPAKINLTDFTELASISSENADNGKFLGVSGSTLGLHTIPAPAAATSETVGGILLGHTSDNNKNYPVQLDADSKAFVNVPWASGLASVPPATDAQTGGFKTGYTENADNYAVKMADGKAYVTVTPGSPNLVGLTDVVGQTGYVKVTTSAGDNPTTTVSFEEVTSLDTTDIDDHLNQGTAGDNQVLSWTGTDYAWVANTGSGGGGGGSVGSFTFGEDTINTTDSDPITIIPDTNVQGTITAETLTSTAAGVSNIQSNSVFEITAPDGVRLNNVPTPVAGGVLTLGSEPTWTGSSEIMSVSFTDNKYILNLNTSYNNPIIDYNVSATVNDTPLFSSYMLNIAKLQDRIEISIADLTLNTISQGSIVLFIYEF